jgi:ferredoxin
MKRISGIFFVLIALIMVGVNSCQPTGSLYSIKQPVCNQCLKCIPVCGYHAITMVTTPTKDTLVIDPNKCVGCGECKIACPIDAITSASSQNHGEENDD